MYSPSPREREFIAYLTNLTKRDERAALAALRRGLGRRPGEVPAMFPYVAPFIHESDSEWREDAYYLVAALFALHQLPWEGDEAGPWRRNLGASFRILSDKKQKGVAQKPDQGNGDKQEHNPGGRNAAVEKRFTVLLGSHREDLPEHLRHAVALLKSEDVPIDWALLLHDVQSWDLDWRPVQREWARGFWGAQQDWSSADGDSADDLPEGEDDYPNEPSLL